MALSESAMLILDPQILDKHVLVLERPSVLKPVSSYRLKGGPAYAFCGDTALLIVRQLHLALMNRRRESLVLQLLASPLHAVDRITLSVP